jgi:hypothetical protein
VVFLHHHHHQSSSIIIIIIISLELGLRLSQKKNPVVVIVQKEELAVKFDM